MKIHGVFLIKNSFGKGLLEIFEGSPVFHPTLCEISQSSKFLDVEIYSKVMQSICNPVREIAGIGSCFVVL